MSILSLCQLKQYNCNYGNHWNQKYTCKIDSYHFNDDTKSYKFTGNDKDKMNTTKLLIEKSKLQYISSLVFEEFPNLDGIKIGMSDMNRVDGKLFSDVISIIFLDLENNKIKELHEESFDNLHKLEYLSLAGNQIETLPNGIFLFNQNLKELDLADNNLKYIEEYAFKHLINLEYLSLWKNHLYTLPKDIFIKNLRLRTVTLADNNIYMIHPDLFTNLPQLHYLNLIDNVCVKKELKTSTQIMNIKYELQECYRRCKSNKNCWNSNEQKLEL